MQTTAEGGAGRGAADWRPSYFSLPIRKYDASAVGQAQAQALDASPKCRGNEYRSSRERDHCTCPRGGKQFQPFSNVLCCGVESSVNTRFISDAKISFAWGRSERLLPFAISYLSLTALSV